MSQVTTLVDLFCLPDVVIGVCSKSFDILQNCLVLCKATRQAVLLQEAELSAYHPNWRLFCLLPASWSCLFGQTEQCRPGDTAILEWGLVRKECMPIVEPKSCYAFIQTPEELTEEYLAGTPLANWKEIEPSVETFVVSSGTFLKFDIMDAHFQFSYEFREGSIYGSVLKDGVRIIEPILVSRNLGTFLTEMRIIENLICSSFDELKIAEVWFIQDIIDILPRFKRCKYDFCVRCGGGRYSGSHQNECYVNPANPTETLCYLCYTHIFNDDGVIRSFQRARWLWESGDVLMRPERQFCQACNKFLFFTPDKPAYMNKDRERSLCVDCFKLTLSPKKWKLDFGPGRRKCDGSCQDGIGLLQKHWTCKTCSKDTDGSFDLCKSCWPKHKDSHQHDKWTYQLNFDEPCFKCGTNIFVADST
jgi:hypothetical protein